ELYLQIQTQLMLAADPPGSTLAVVSPHYANAAILLLLVVPLITMRLISEERKNGTLSLLFSAPLSITEIVLGKFFGVMSFLILGILLISFAPLSLLFSGSLDLGLFISNVLGLFLMIMTFCSLGLLISSLTKQPLVAVIATFSTLIFLWIIDWAGRESSDSTMGAILQYFSLTRHYENLLKGVFNTSDIVYYLSLSFSFLVLTIFFLDNRRLQG
ncbi:MAG: ABC transporter permease, partial [Gammaproteobacteria bacterium]|nr:ABC transporter permease [Gammaproteobacteria bacterium]